MDKQITLSNEQAFRAYAAGNVDALQMMTNNFEYFIRSKAAYFVNIANDEAVEYRDLHLIGHTALYNAIRLYRGDSIPFTAFAITVIQNAMLNHLASMTTPTSRLNRRGISLDDFMYVDNDSLLMSDSIGEEVNTEEGGFYAPRHIGFFPDFFLANYTTLELTIITAKIEGYAYHEIRERMQLSKRKFDALIMGIKKKHQAALD
jgi:hypothetical protein